MEIPVMSIKDKVSRSLSYSVWDGLFYAIMAGFGESFFIPFAIFLGLSNVHIALLNSLPQFIGSLAQVFSLKVIKFFPSRRFFVCSTAFLQGFTHLLLASIVISRNNLALLVFLAIIFYWTFGMMGSPAWSSWMGDLVDSNRKGSYFGKRNLVVGITLFVAFMTAGKILDLFDGQHKTQFWGFVLIFVIAFFARTISSVFLSKQYEPKYVERKSEQFSFIEFVEQLTKRKFGILALYLSLMNFAVAISAPFFTVYMLKDLGFGYLAFTIVTSVALVVKYLFMPVWGMYADKYGSRIALAVSGLLIPFLPIAWIFSKSIWVILLIQVFGGFAWAGFELCSFNFMFDSTSKEKRARCFAYYNAINGTFVLIGGLLGGLIVMYNHVFWSKFLLVFLVSGVLRLVISLMMISKLKEVREVEHISYKDFLLKVLSVKSLFTVLEPFQAFSILNLNGKKKKK